MPLQNISSTTAFDQWLMGKICAAIGNAPIRLILWDGTEFCPPGTAPVGSVLIKDRTTLIKLLMEPELNFGDGYTEGRIEVEGDLLKILVAVNRALSEVSSSGLIHELLSRWMDRRQANSLNGSARNIHHHYDLGTDFYRLWLDSQLVYTCAYFDHPDNTLEEAQIAKMNHVCRKVWLQPGDTVAEAGCGWGSLALLMAKHHGARVKAFNISHDQIVYARRRAEQEGLSGQVEFVEDDYRNISGKFDVFLSVGMLEHVGADHYRDLGAVIHRCLKEQGRGFLHFIGRNRPQRLSLWTSKRIFPGAFPPTLRDAMEIFEGSNFSLLDVENLRLHYARTIEHWLERFEKSRDKVAVMFGPAFVRTWRLYLTSAMAAFLSGSMQLFQIAFARGTDNSIPWTRAHLYRSPADEEEGKWIAATS